MNSILAFNNLLLGKRLTIIPLLGIIIITLLVDNYLFDPFLKSSEVYTEAEIRFEPIRGEDVALYGFRERKNKFLFAATTLEELYLGLKFPSSANLTVNIEPIYEDSGCRDGGLNEARISFHGDTVNHIAPLHHTIPTQFNFSVSKDQVINVTVSNRYYPDCGKALINFVKHNNNGFATEIFGLIWLLIFLVCLSIRTSTLVALLGASFNALLIWAETTLGNLSALSISAYLTLSIGFAGFIMLFTALPFASKLLAILLSLFIAGIFWLPIAVIGHEFIFSSPINDESIHAILQSYLSQAIEFWGQFVGAKNTIYGLLGLGVICLLCFRLNHFKSNKALCAWIAITFIAMATVLTIDRWHGSKIFNLIDKSIKIYQYEIASFQQISSTRAQQKINTTLDSKFENNTTVFVIGESVNRSHMSAYGYFKKTTPFIDQRIADENVIRFSNVFSNHTHSNPTISFLLTQANQYNNKAWVESPSILNITNETSVKSTWLTNHRLLGGWSNYITAIAQDANTVKTINNKIGRGNSAFQYDGSLLPLWREAIQDQPNQASFLHFYNSHIDYCSRYPDSAEKFNDKVTRAYFGEWTNNRKVDSAGLNCYDNSIFYTDQLLEEIIQDLDSRSRPSVLVYIPDHSDDVLQARFHNAVLYTHAMTTVPLFIWANDEWRQQHSDLWENLLNNKDKPFTNDLMFDSMSGLLGISAEPINPSYDFSSDQFNPPKTLKTLHGRRTINDPLNWRYWQIINSQKLINQGYQLGATNADSVAKASIALNIGFELLQVNVLVSKAYEFEVTDENFTPIGIDLNSFLQDIDHQNLKTLLVTINNQEQINDIKLHEELDNITSKYSVTAIINDQQNHFSNTPKLADSRLLQQAQIKEHAKSNILMLDLTTQFDKLIPIIETPKTDN